MYQGKLREIAQYPDVQVHLIVPHAWPEHNQWVVAQNTDSHPYTTHIVRAFRLGRIASYFYQPFVFRKTVQYIRPDIIYAEEEPWSVAAWQSIGEAKRVGAKFIFFTWENLWRRYKWISEKILLYVLKNSSAAVAGNKDAESILRRRGFLKPITHLPQYGVDLGVFQKLHEETPPEVRSLRKPRIAYIGRLEKEKGIYSLFEALKLLEGDWSLLVVGSGTEKESLIHISKTLAIDGRIQFVDAVAHEEVPSYLQNVDVLVLPSLTTPTWKEQFGRVLIEAMAAGVPVIGSDSGAVPEVIGDAGLTFSEGNVFHLRNIIEQLISSSELRNRLARQGRERAKMMFSNSHIAQRLHNFFVRVNSGKG